MVSILIVEDDARIRSALTRALSDRGHAVSSVSTAMAGLQSVLDAPPDLVLLDLGLPDVDGREALRMVRAVSRVPLIVVTARDDEAEIVRVLDAGADDYVVKPFDPGQLDARIRAVLRRTGSGQPAASLVVGGLVLDMKRRTATLDGEELQLSPKEFALLQLLAERVGEVVSKRDILAEVWRRPYGGGDRTVDVHLSWLRRKLGETADEPRYLHSVHSVGVRLEPPPDGRR